jgi:hypothetical protein
LLQVLSHFDLCDVDCYGIQHSCYKSYLTLIYAMLIVL